MGTENTRPVHPVVIIRRVCEWYHVPTGEVLKHNKSPRVLKARRAIAYLLKEEGLSYPEIGAELNKDHSGIHYLVNTGDVIEKLGGEEAFNELRDFVYENECS